MTTYFAIAAIIAVAGFLIFWGIRRRENQAREIGRGEIIQQVQHEEREADRRVDKVLGERRDAADTTGRLSNGDF